jgi:hypothetical protein
MTPHDVRAAAEHMAETDSAFEKEHQRPSYLAARAAGKTIRSIIGGLLGAASGGCGSAVGTTLVLAGIGEWERWNGWVPLTLIVFSPFPMLGGFVGGGFIGAVGARAGGLVLGSTLGGVLGAWSQCAVVMLLTRYSVPGSPHACTRGMFAYHRGYRSDCC